MQIKRIGLVFIMGDFIHPEIFKLKLKKNALELKNMELKCSALGAQSLKQCIRNIVAML